MSALEKARLRWGWSEVAQGGGKGVLAVDPVGIGREPVQAMGPVSEAIAEAGKQGLKSLLEHLLTNKSGNKKENDDKPVSPREWR